MAARKKKPVAPPAVSNDDWLEAMDFEVEKVYRSLERPRRASLAAKRLEDLLDARSEILAIVERFDREIRIVAKRAVQ